MKVCQEKVTFSEIATNLKGFPGNGTNCWNIDECEANLDNCAEEGKFRNLEIKSKMRNI